jgi:hypothetical protein
MSNRKNKFYKLIELMGELWNTFDFSTYNPPLRLPLP